MAKFTVNPALDAMLARLVAPHVQRIASRVEVEAKRFAPATKEWVTAADEQMRPTHVNAQGQIVPSNLRFSIRSMDWDRKHRGVGRTTYMQVPRDESSRAVANLKNCRCVVTLDPEGIARNISTSQPVISGKKVTVTVTARAPMVVEAEVGTVYPDGLTAAGTYFMARAVAAVAARP
ncbi:hypothetical protein AB0C52_13120 [Streptomyces sp. NPDC048717]|uniref:hypothetical protein n=1 Tax=Streptomyces sp. NPDC048717 TaxID=3154928 RepID=UPI0034167EBC